MFRTAFDPKARFFSRCGHTHVPEYVLAYHENGVQYLKEVGQKNIYKMIQAHADECDLHVITSRLDPKQLNNAMSSFRVEDVDSSLISDLTSCPATLGDALNNVKQAEHLFNGLPLEVRKEFNFSTNAFIKSIGTDKFNKIFQQQQKGVVSDGVLSVPVPGNDIVNSVPDSSIQASQQVVTKKKKKVIEIEVDDDE